MSEDKGKATSSETPKSERTTSSKDRSVPKISPKLGGQQNYAVWIWNLECALTAFDIAGSVDSEEDDYTIWDLVKGEYQEPDQEEDKRAHRRELKADKFAAYAIGYNCEEEAASKLGIGISANEMYKGLIANYEGKTVTDMGGLIRKVVRMNFDDRTHTIDEHIGEFERNWSFMRTTIQGGKFPDNIKEDEDWMQKMSKSDGFKGIILISSLPPYYASLTENLRLNNDKYTYGDIVNTLRTYVPERQKHRNKNGPTAGKTQHGSLENPIVLKVEKDRFGRTIDTSKTCQYCKRKGWRGIGHTESECRTKQREAQRAAVKKTEFDLDEDILSMAGGVEINGVSIYKLTNNRTGWYEFDSGAQAHTTNELDRLVDKKISIVTVNGHDGHTTQAQYEGNIYLPHNGHTIRLRKVLYHPQFSNLVSGLKVAKVYTLQLSEQRVKLLHGQDEVYDMERDSTGWWIKPDDLGTNGAEELSIMTIGTDIQKKCLKELHERYGHISFSLIKKLPEGRQYKSTPDLRCTACELGKSTKPAAPASTIGPIRTSRPLERIHCDLITMSHEWLGRKYALTILYDYSRFCSVIPLRGKDKSSVWAALIRTIKEWERATEKLVY